jgi:hypothetical protein
VAGEPAAAVEPAVAGEAAAAEADGAEDRAAGLRP